jgi:hypothetical protein
LIVTDGTMFFSAAKRDTKSARNEHEVDSFYSSPIDCSHSAVLIEAIYGFLPARLKEQGLHELPARPTHKLCDVAIVYLCAIEQTGRG